MPTSLTDISGGRVGRRMALRKFLDHIPRNCASPYYSPNEIAGQLHCSMSRIRELAADKSFVRYSIRLHGVRFWSSPWHISKLKVELECRKA